MWEYIGRMVSIGSLFSSVHSLKQSELYAAYIHCTSIAVLSSSTTIIMTLMGRTQILATGCELFLHQFILDLPSHFFLMCVPISYELAWECLFILLLLAMYIEE